MEFIKQNLIRILLVSLLLVGVVVAVILLGQKQIFKSRASTQGLKVNSNQGEVKQQDDGTFTTTSNSIKIEVGDLEKLR